MAKMIDPNGIQWSVRRRWWPLPHAFFLMDLVDTLSVVGILLVLPMLLAWPFWLIAKVLGVRWRLVVRRDGKVVDQELVRGWSRSKARMAQIGASIEDGSVSLPATESEAH